MFSQMLKNLRESHGLTQAQLAKEIGVDRTSIGKYETTNTTPNFEVLKTIASFFKVTTDFLLGMDEVNPEDRSHILRTDNGVYFLYGGSAGIMEDFDRMDETDKKSLLSYARFLLSADKYKPPVQVDLDAFLGEGDPDGKHN